MFRSRSTVSCAAVLALVVPLSLGAPAPATAAEPTRIDGSLLAAAPAGNTPQVTVPGLGSFTADVDVVHLPRDQRLLRVGAMALKTSAPQTASGIVQYRHRVTGRLYDHPVVQANHVLGWLESYDRSKDPRLLAAAVRNAERLRSKAIPSRGALYFAYPFDFALHGKDRYTLEGPWYSAMGQGHVLAAFVRLYRVTGDPRWKRAADATFRSFLLPRRAGMPWTVDIVDGHLWFEEYAHDRHPDRAFNGHNFALFGLYDYWNLTDDAAARNLLRGALTSSRDLAARFRAPGEVSRYCLTHGVRSAGYHGIHVRQLSVMAGITGDRRFSRLADAFLDDAPVAYGGGAGRLAHGTHPVVRRDGSGRVARSSAIAPRRASTVQFGRRARIPGRAGLWLLVASGPYRGWWVREAPGRAFVSGRLDELGYTPARTVRFAPGRVIAVRFDARGRRLASRTVTFTRTSAASASGRVAVDATTYYRMSTGSLAGWYVPRSSRVAAL